MKCAFCGAEMPANETRCPACGATTVTPVPPVAPAAPAAPAAAPQPVKLLGPWAYFGLQLLFSIPLVGFILLIVFSLDNSNLNRRNFARSYWCSLIVGLVLALLVVILLVVTGAGATILSELS